MKNVSTRLFIIVGLVLVAYGIGYFVQAATEPPNVEFPKWSITDLPTELGSWHGEDTEMDTEIAIATGAASIVNRIYRDDKGRAVSLHFAMFKDPAEGVYHSPLNCYRSSGWTKLRQSQEDVKVSEDLSIPISVVTWQKEHDKVAVAYWYQLGQHVLYSRLDLGGSIRWKMRGQPTWPVLVKVMLQVPVNDSDDARAAILDFGETLSKWLNSPEHRQYLDRWGGV